MDGIISTLKIMTLDIDRAELCESWRYSGVNSPFCRLYFIDSGEGFTRHHGCDFHLSPGNLYLIPSHSNAEMSCPEHMTQYYVHFNAELLSGVNLFHVFKPFYQISLESLPYVPGLIYRLYALRASEVIGEVIEVDAILRLLIALFFPGKYEESSQNMPTIRRFEPVLRYIDECLTEKITLPDLAMMVNLQPTYFSNSFCACFGIPPIQYLIRKRIEKARELLLLERSKTLKEIAADVGFDDVFYFSRLFKKHSGTSPTQYREQQRLVLT